MQTLDLIKQMQIKISVQCQLLILSIQLQKGFIGRDCV